MRCQTCILRYQTDTTLNAAANRINQLCFQTQMCVENLFMAETITSKQRTIIQSNSETFHISEVISISN